MSKIIKGSEVSAKLSEEIKDRIEKLKGLDVIPCVAIVRASEAEDAISYEKGAVKKMQALGIDVNNVVLSNDVSQEQFVAQISALNGDSKVHGILILQPLPAQLDENIVKMLINPHKDIDAISPINLYKVMAGDCTGFAPCTPEAVIRILDYMNVEIAGKRVAVVGRSLVVGKPLASLFINRSATVTVCHSKTNNISKVCSEAEIVVAAVGKSGLVKGDFVSDDAIVIDVGINVTSEGKLCGDVDFDTVEPKVSLITPVPGGVGAVTTTILAEHVVKAAEILKTH